MDTNGHEWIKSRKTRNTRKTQNHEWTRMGTKVGSREKKGEGSAWMARLGAPARRFRRASIEKERTTNGHEWARMDQTTKDTKDTKKLRTTNGHEWTRKESRGLLNHEWARKESRGLLNHEWARISVVGGLLPSLACGLPSTVDGMQCAISSQFAHLPSGESRDGVGILVVDGVSAARCERSPR